MTPTQADAEREVLATEDAYVAAEIDADEAALRNLVDDRFVFNASNGTTSGKEALIRSVVGMGMTGQTLSERSVLVEEPVALIFGTTEIRTARDGGAEHASSLRYTSTYVRRDGTWRLLALQMQGRSD